jgi:uncharacterized protein YhbP (UPF0306 family)
MDNQTAKTIELVKEVLTRSYLMSLAIVDEGGVWVADVIYVFDDELNIYWMSDPDVRHSQAILKNDKVSGTITTSGPQEQNMGIQFSGVAEKIDGPRFDLAKKHFLKRNKPEPVESADVLEGDSWFTLKPKLIQLTYEKLFGFDKQNLNL